MYIHFDNLSGNALSYPCNNSSVFCFYNTNVLFLKSLIASVTNKMRTNTT